MKIEYLKNGNVISIAAARTGMKFPAVAQAEGYWEGLRGNRLVPSRSDLDPRGISGILEYAFILEKIAPGMAKIRLSGQGLNDILGMEMRGMPITSIFLPEARAEIQNALENLFDKPSTVQATLTSKGGFTRKTLTAQLYMAPMLDDQGRVTRALGALQVQGGIDRTPRRFSFQSLSINPILSDDPLPAPKKSDSQLDRYERATQRIPGLSEHAAGFAAQAPKSDMSSADMTASDRGDFEDTSETTRRGHLRLVEGE